MLSARDFPLLPVFVAVATTGSFTRAATRLGLGKSVVSAHVKALEERCGARLIERTTRRLVLTEIGQAVLESAQQVLSSYQAFGQVVDRQADEPSGTLRVTCPLDAGLSSVVARATSVLTAAHPNLRVELLFDDLVHDLHDEKLDVALRLNPMVDANYVMRRLGSVPEVIVASPALFEREDAHAEPSSLAGASWIVHTALKPRSTWTFRGPEGERVQVRVDLKFSVNTALAVRDLLLCGAGFAVLPLHMVKADLLAGRLKQACPDFIHRRLILHAVLPGRALPPRTRAFLAGVASRIELAGFEPNPSA